MPTNKIVLRTVDQFMADYTPIYQPIYPLFLGKSQQYAAEVGKLDFRRLDTVGDIRAKHITPKDTVMAQFGAMEGTKSFKKYFLANQFTVSSLQDRQGLEDVTAQVLDEHQKQADDLLLLGEGTSDSTMVNNGLFWSGDANYTLETSTGIAVSSRLYDFHAKVIVTAQKANQVPGRKVLMFYGADIAPFFNSLYDTAAKAWKVALQEVLGPEYSVVYLPTAVTPAGANGWLIANLDQCKLHYTLLPQVLANGINEEKMYYWSNFALGSMMLEVLAPDAVVRQPATLDT